MVARKACPQALKSLSNLEHFPALETLSKLFFDLQKLQLAIEHDLDEKMDRGINDR
jgi:hypothetical protein